MSSRYIFSIFTYRVTLGSFMYNKLLSIYEWISWLLIQWKIYFTHITQHKGGLFIWLVHWMTEKRLVSSNYNSMSRCCFLCGVKMLIDYWSSPACCDSCFNSNYKTLILQLSLYNSTHLTILRTALINTMRVLNECFISGLWAPIYANMCTHACVCTHTHTHKKKVKNL
jgi:hypothetical protein